jgi:two-component system, response regulator RpfG
MSVSILNVGMRENERPLLEAANNASGYSVVHTVADPAEAGYWAGEHQPDITVVDVRWLNGRGIDFMRRFRANRACADLPLLALVDEHDRNHRHQSLRAGANELISAPLDAYECQVRILNMLTVRAHRKLLDRTAILPAPGIDDFNNYASAREREILLRLARAGEYRDETTGAHIVRIGKLSRGIAEVLGLGEPECTIIEAAAPMHDIGKIGIPDAILRKPGSLTESERSVMKTHTLIGYEILKDSSSPFVQRGAEIALSHHEKFDGSGYPAGIRGHDIPISARIVAVADVYDALTSKRDYKSAWLPSQACEYIAGQEGAHFDPECVKALFARLKTEVCN